MNNSKIEWTDKTWNPVTGCTKVSQGCKNCYAERMMERFQGKGSFRNVTCHPDRLSIPLKWKKPSMIFVNSMSDLFHEEVPFEFIRAVFSVMSDLDHHIYQVLTKRPERMLQFYQWMEEELGFPWNAKENVWLGVSVENQKAADERIPYLLKVPARVRFLSCEPLLGPVNISKPFGFDRLLQTQALQGISWVICGGESGPGARPMHPEWARSLRDQCAAACVPFFFKQWGEYYTKSTLMGTEEPHFRMFISLQHWVNKGHTWVRGGRCISIDGRECHIGKDFKECDYPVVVMDRVGKGKSGRVLDNVIHSEYPKALKASKFFTNSTTLETTHY